MNVPSLQFLAFAALVALIINISNAPFWRRSIFIVANLAFILSFDRDLTDLMPFAVFVVFGFLARKCLELRKSRLMFSSIVSIMILALCWLKRYAFFPEQMLLHHPYFSVGISYVFFRIMHLIIDAHQDHEIEPLTLPAYLSFTLSFVALVSGPIQLFGSYRLSETMEPSPINADIIGGALQRIIFGYFKVAIVGQLLYLLLQYESQLLVAETSLGARIVISALLIALFPAYLYYNFSGYTDFVIGVARFMRLSIPENFNKPFTALSFLDLWSRWHISLSSWIRTYLYTPIMLMLLRRFRQPERAPFLGIIAFFVAFFAIGIWHGSTVMFVIYGLLLGLGVTVNKLFQTLMKSWLGAQRYRDLVEMPLCVSYSRSLTCFWFAFALLWFWKTSAQLQVSYSLLGPKGAIASVVLLILLAAPFLSLLIWLRAFIDKILQPNVGFQRAMPYLRAAGASVLVAILLSANAILNAPAPTIVYKGF